MAGASRLPLSDGCRVRSERRSSTRTLCMVLPRHSKAPLARDLAHVVRAPDAGRSETGRLLQSSGQDTYRQTDKYSEAMRKSGSHRQTGLSRNAAVHAATNNCACTSA